MVRLPQVGASPVDTSQSGAAEVRQPVTISSAALQAIVQKHAACHVPAPGTVTVGHVGDLTAAKAALECELAALQSEHKALSAEAQKIEGKIAALSAEIERLAAIEAGLSEAGSAQRGQVKTTKVARRAVYEEAKTQVDQALASLRTLGVPETELAAARKRILMRLARTAIQAGAGPDKPMGPEWIRGELDKLKDLALARATTPAQKALVDKTLVSLEGDLTRQRDAISKKQRVVNGHRRAAESCEEKARDVGERMREHRGSIEEGEERLGQIRPRLAKIERRIETLKAAISLIDATIQLIKINEQLAEKRHEKKMEQADERRIHDRALEVRKATERLESQLRENRRSEAKAASDEVSERQLPNARADILAKAVADLRAAASRPGAADGEVREALSALEKLVSAASAEQARATKGAKRGLPLTARR